MTIRGRFKQIMLFSFAIKLYCFSTDNEHEILGRSSHAQAISPQANCTYHSQPWINCLVAYELTMHY